MRTVQRPCDVTQFTTTGTPRVIVMDEQVYHLSRELACTRFHGRRWLGEPSRDVWELECGPVTMEVCRFDREWQGSQWWIMRIED